MTNDVSAIMRTHNFTGCRILVKNANDESQSFGSEITEHNKAYQSIVVKLIDDINWELSQLIIIVFSEGKIFQFSGNARKVATSANTFEIAVFKAAQKEDRTEQRFAVDICADIKAVLIDSTLIFLNKPLQVKILNVSTKGIMFEGMSGAFQKGDVFRISAVAMDTNTVFNVKIVRRRNTDLLTMQYGCKLVTINEGSGENAR